MSCAAVDRALWIGIAASAALVPSALAGTVGPWTIRVVEEGGREASWSIPALEAGESRRTVELVSPGGSYGVVSLGRTPRGSDMPGPTVGLSYDVTAGSVATTFIIGSALLSFPAMSSPTGHAFGDVEVSDLNGDGALYTGNGPGGNSYWAQYNGYAGTQSGTSFTEQLASIAAPAGGSNSDSFDTGYSTIVASVLDISTAWSFRLTAHDRATGNSTFELDKQPGIVPLPSGAGLGACGLLGLAVRRRRA